jgi:ABC-2 type transport system permease protein
MTSKNLFFKLLKEDLKRRIWTIALSVLAFFLFLTVALAINIGNYDPDYFGKEQIAENIAGMIGPQYLIVSFITIAGALICGLSSFFYLHSRKKVDLYHSIPVRREMLFAVSYLNGLLIYLVPYIINVLLCFVLLQMNRLMSLDRLFLAFTAVGINLLFYCLIYTLAIIAVMLTGNIVVSCLGTAVFLVYGPVLMGIKVMYCTEFFKTYAGGRSDSVILRFLSPLGSYLYAADPRSLGDYQVDHTSIIKTVLVTVLLLLFALFLYKKRPSEAAGKAMAFSVSKPIIKFLLVLPAALLGGIIFKQISANRSTGWFIFGLVFVFIVSGAIIEIIYNFDVRCAFGRKRHMLISGAIVAAIVCIFQFDLIKFDLYIPDENKIESMSVSISGLDSNLNYLERESDGNSFEYVGRDAYQLKHMKITDFGAAYTLAGIGISEAKGIHEINMDDYYTYKIKYSLKNGRSVYRNYNLNLDQNYDLLKDIFIKEEYKKAHYPIYTWEADDLSYVSCNSMTEDKVFSLNAEEKQELLDIYRAELMGLTLDEITAGQPDATIVFWLKEGNTLKQRGEYSSSYYVYSQFTKTKEFLKAHGFDASIRVGAQDVKSITVINNRLLKNEYNVYQQEYATTDKELEPSVTYFDKEKIEEILPLVIDSDYYWNFRTLFNCDRNLEVHLVVQTDDFGNEFSYSCLFKDSIPDFVKEDAKYKEAPQEISK